MIYIYKNYFTAHLIAIILLCSMIGCNTDQSNPEDVSITCYAAAYGKGIYKTDNGGKSWFPIAANQGEIHHYFKRLYLSPAKDTLYIATIGAGLFMMNLLDEEFTDVKEFGSENIRTLAFTSAVNQKKINYKTYIGMEANGVYESRFRAGDWQAFNNGLDFLDVNVLFTHEGDLFAGTNKDLFKWDENIKKWKVTSEGISNKNIISMAADLKGEIFYAGAGPYEDERGFFEVIPCLFKSMDKGKTWQPCDNGIPGDTLVFTIAFVPQKNKRIYIGTSDGLYISTDQGKNWEKEKSLPKGIKVFDIKIAPIKDGKDVVFAASSNGVYMTTNDENTLWKEKSYGLEKTAITSIVLMAEN